MRLASSGFCRPFVETGLVRAARDLVDGGGGLVDQLLVKINRLRVFVLARYTEASANLPSAVRSLLEDLALPEGCARQRRSRRAADEVSPRIARHVGGSSVGGTYRRCLELFAGFGGTFLGGGKVGKPGCAGTPAGRTCCRAPESRRPSGYSPFRPANLCQVPAAKADERNHGHDMPAMSSLD